MYVVAGSRGCFPEKSLKFQNTMNANLGILAEIVHYCHI